MWNQQNETSFGAGGGGGFMNSPSQVGKTPIRRTMRVATVAISELLESTTDEFQLEGQEVTYVEIVGLVTSVTSSTTRLSYTIEDQTGSIEVLYYLGTDGEDANTVSMLSEGTYGRIVGKLRSFKENDDKYMILFKSQPVTDMNEVSAHICEVIGNHLKLRHLNQLEESKTGVRAPIGGNVNSLIPGRSAGREDDLEHMGIPGMSRSQKIVMNVIQNCTAVKGIHRDDIITSLYGKLTTKEILSALEGLSNEGHIFSSIDEDHFKSTDMC